MRVHGQRGAPDWASAAKTTSSFFARLWDSILLDGLRAFASEELGSLAKAEPEHVYVGIE